MSNLVCISTVLDFSYLTGLNSGVVVTVGLTVDTMSLWLFLSSLELLSISLTSPFPFLSIGTTGIGGLATGDAAGVVSHRLGLGGDMDRMFLSISGSAETCLLSPEVFRDIKGETGLLFCEVVSLSPRKTCEEYERA